MADQRVRGIERPVAVNECPSFERRADLARDRLLGEAEAEIEPPAIGSEEKTSLTAVS